MAGPQDLVYMDPPYQSTSGNRDQRYHQQLDIDRFVSELKGIRMRGVPFIISFDGQCGNKTYGRPLPEELDLTRLQVHVGRSSQATLNGRRDETVESLYVSPELAAKDGGIRPQRSGGASRNPAWMPQDHPRPEMTQERPLEALHGVGRP